MIGDEVENLLVRILVSPRSDTKVDESTGEESSPLNDEYKNAEEIPSNGKRQEIHDKNHLSNVHSWKVVQRQDTELF